MTIRQIETLEYPERYQARFSEGDKDVLVITHSQEVEADMCRSR